MNQQSKQVSAITGHDCSGKSTSDELGQNPNCPHGYDIACLICGFGQKDGKRVWHNKTPKAEVSVRTNESDFAVGDLVVVLNPRATKNIFEVKSLTQEGVFANECTAVFIMRHFFTFDLIRLATLAEIELGHRIDTPTVCIEQETAELFNSKHCSPRNYIKQYYNNVTDAQRLKELDASVDHAKAALAKFNYEPIPTDRELKQAEQIRILRTDRNVWCAMFFIAVVGYGVARWML